MPHRQTISWIARSQNWKESDEVVWVSAAKLDKLSKGDTGYYVGHRGSGNAIQGRYEQFGNWIKDGNAIWMPEVCLLNNEFISFIDGRHRFAWLSDHGIQSLPILTPKEEAKKIFLLCGTEVRVSDYSS